MTDKTEDDGDMIAHRHGFDIGLKVAAELAPRALEFAPSAVIGAIEALAVALADATDADLTGKLLEDIARELREREAEKKLAAAPSPSGSAH